MNKQAQKINLAMGKNCDEVARILKTIAHPQRLMILCHLSQGEKTVSELEELCETSQSAMSQFLTKMRLEGLVQSEKQGQFVYYRIEDPRAEELLKAMYKIFCQ